MCAISPLFTLIIMCLSVTVQSERGAACVGVYVCNDTLRRRDTLQNQLREILGSRLFVSSPHSSICRWRSCTASWPLGRTLGYRAVKAFNLSAAAAAWNSLDRPAEHTRGGHLQKQVSASHYSAVWPTEQLEILWHCTRRSVETLRTSLDAISKVPNPLQLTSVQTVNCPSV